MSSDLDRPTTTPAVLDRAVRLHGDRLAIVDGPRRLTYTDFAREVDRFAAGLIGFGIETGDRVAIWAPNSLDWLVAAFGIHAAGGVLVPISTRYRAAEAEHLLRAARVRLLLAADRFLDHDFVAERAAMAELPDLEAEFALHDGPTRHPAERASLLSLGDPIDAKRIAARRDAVSAEDAAEIIFTSGTTGRPKGVVLGHHAGIRTYEAWSDAVGLRAGDQHLVPYPFFHTAGLKSGVLSSVLVGATIHVLEAFEPGVVLEMVERERITVLPGPPTVFQMILQHPDRHRRDLSSVRCSVTGAAIVPAEVIRAMREDLGIRTVVTGYGLTETCGTVSICDHDDPIEVVSRTVGRPLPGVEVRITDDDGRDVTPGEAGEIVVRGFNVMSGYFEDPVATEAAFRQGGWLRTGDVGRFDDTGRLEITDRLKDMIIVGGFNVYPAEVEAMLLERDDIAQIAVVGMPDDRLGEVPLAFVIPVAERDLDPDELYAWSRERMANYKVPRRFEVVAELPLTATGKVQKPALRDRVEALLADTDYTAAATEAKHDEPEAPNAGPAAGDKDHADAEGGRP